MKSMEFAGNTSPLDPAFISRQQVATSVGKRILVFDPEGEVSSSIDESFGDENEIALARTPGEATSLLARGRGLSFAYDLLLWNLTPPWETGLEDLHRVRDTHPGLRIILLAPQEALAFAKAIKLADVDAFILKPLHAHDLVSAVERAFSKDRSKEKGNFRASLNVVSRSNGLTNSPLEIDDGSDLGLIGRSPEMRKIFSLIRKIGPTSVNVLITGESGSGKEVVANAIHRCSDRAHKPFVAINCAAIPRDLLESELFGHARGAFTGATNARRGLFEEAHEGTILLDEIGDLPLPLQAKILRLIQTRQVKPLGQNYTREVDVRIISATHKNLKALIQKGEFREDLYYRLNVMPVHIPPLRERKEDILLLAEYFLRRYAERRKVRPPVLDKRAEQRLLSMPWRGNVRELENVIERAIVLSDGVTITESDILNEESEVMPVTAEDLFNSGMSLKDIEREYIRYVLNRVGNRKEAATKILGIDRKTLYRKEKLYGLRST